MKTWSNPVLAELDIRSTEYKLFGNKRDGGYVGDGIISGHLEWECGGGEGGTGGTPDVEDVLS